jgi:type IV pilus assembly protein PilW
MRVTPKHGSIKNLSQEGFSLVELLVALAIFGLVVGSIYSSFSTQNTIYHAQEKVVAIQQNLRAAMFIMEKGIRMAGYDPDRAGTFGVEVCGLNTITFTQQDDRPNQAAGTIIRTTFTLNGPDLRRTVVGGPNPTGTDLTLAQNIQAFGLAYAYDANGDGALDTDDGTATGDIVWAIDTDNANGLDLNLDTDEDGIIEQTDAAGNTVIGPIAAVNIRAVRIWILGRSDPTRPEGGHSDTNTYVVGRTIVNSPNDGLYRRMLTSIVKCRNMGVR